MSVPRFWRRLKNIYNLIGTHCEKCGSFLYPPRNMCPKCRRNSMTIPFKFKGTGEVITYTIVHTGAKDYTKLTPYILAVSYTHLRAHETRHDLVCRLLLEKKKKK